MNLKKLRLIVKRQNGAAVAQMVECTPCDWKVPDLIQDPAVNMSLSKTQDPNCFSCFMTV